MQDQSTQQLRTERIILRISPQLRHRLDQTGNLSAYIRESVERRFQRFQEARILLERQGWKRNEIRAVMDLMNGTFVTFAVPLPAQVVASMEDGATDQGIHDKWGITAERWQRLAALAQQEPVARALVALAEEYWSDAPGHAEDAL